jgi:hypothetical protein
MAQVSSHSENFHFEHFSSPIRLLDLILDHLCMFSTRSAYKKLGLKPVKPLQDRPYQTQKQLMGDENKYDGARDPFKMLLKEALT